MEELSDPIKVLADPTHLGILDFLYESIQRCCSREEICACDLELSLSFSQPTINNHLELLEQAGFMSIDRYGRWVFHELLTEGFTTLRETSARFKQLEETV